MSYLTQSLPENSAVGTENLQDVGFFEDPRVLKVVTFVSDVMNTDKEASPSILDALEVNTNPNVISSLLNSLKEQLENTIGGQTELPAEELLTRLRGVISTLNEVKSSNDLELLLLNLRAFGINIEYLLGAFNLPPAITSNYQGNTRQQTITGTGGAIGPTPDEIEEFNKISGNLTEGSSFGVKIVVMASLGIFSMVSPTAGSTVVDLLKTIGIKPEIVNELLLCENTFRLDINTYPIGIFKIVGEHDAVPNGKPLILIRDPDTGEIVGKGIWVNYIPKGSGVISFPVPDEVDPLYTVTDIQGELPLGNGNVQTKVLVLPGSKLSILGIDPNDPYSYALAPLIAYTGNEHVPGLKTEEGVPFAVLNKGRPFIAEYNATTKVITPECLQAQRDKLAKQERGKWEALRQAYLLLSQRQLAYLHQAKVKFDLTDPRGTVDSWKKAFERLASEYPLFVTGETTSSGNVDTEPIKVPTNDGYVEVLEPVFLKSDLELLAQISNPNERIRKLREMLGLSTTKIKGYKKDGNEGPRVYTNEVQVLGIINLNGNIGPYAIISINGGAHPIQLVRLSELQLEESPAVANVALQMEPTVPEQLVNSAENLVAKLSEFTKITPFPDAPIYYITKTNQFKAPGTIIMTEDPYNNHGVKAPYGNSFIFMSEARLLKPTTNPNEPSTLKKLQRFANDPATNMVGGLGNFLTWLTLDDIKPSPGTFIIRPVGEATFTRYTWDPINNKYKEDVSQDGVFSIGRNATEIVSSKLIENMTKEELTRYMLKKFLQSREFKNLNAY